MVGGGVSALQPSTNFFCYTFKLILLNKSFGIIQELLSLSTYRDVFGANSKFKAFGDVLKSV